MINREDHSRLQRLVMDRRCAKLELEECRLTQKALEDKINYLNSAIDELWDQLYKEKKDD